MKLTKNINTGDEELVFRTISTSPKEHFEGRWKSGRLYPLYSVVVNNGTTFVSQNAKMKEEPYVIYDAVKQEFKANDGWKIKEMSADSRLTALGGGSAGGGVTPEDVAEMISGKQDTIEDLSTIRSGASAGATAYQKPNSGIPASDIASGVIPTDVVKYSLQTLTDAQKAEARANIEAQDYLVSGTNIKTVNGESILGSGNIVAGDPNAVKYTEQTLTDAQKTQSRTNIGAGTYSKPSGGIPASDIASGVIPTVPTISTDVSADAASDVKTSSPKSVKAYVDAGIAAVGSDLSDLADEVDTIGNGAYEEAWDGSSAPVVADIPAGVSVTYNSTSYTGTLAASASTVDKIYLVSDGNGNYDRYVTIENSGTYSWKKVGTTAIPLSDYATKTEVSQLEAKVTDLLRPTIGTPAITWSDGYYNTALILAGGNNYKHSTPIQMKAGDALYYYTGDSYGSIAMMVETNSEGKGLKVIQAGISVAPRTFEYLYIAEHDTYVVLSSYASKVATNIVKLIQSDTIQDIYKNIVSNSDAIYGLDKDIRGYKLGDYVWTDKQSINPSTGELQTNTDTIGCSIYFPIPAGANYVRFLDTDTIDTNVVWYNLGFYGSDYSFISRSSYAATTKWELPSGTAFVRVVLALRDSEGQSIGGSQADYNIGAICMFFSGTTKEELVDLEDKVSETAAGVEGVTNQSESTNVRLNQDELSLGKSLNLSLMRWLDGKGITEIGIVDNPKTIACPDLIDVRGFSRVVFEDLNTGDGNVLYYAIDQLNANKVVLNRLGYSTDGTFNLRGDAAYIYVSLGLHNGSSDIGGHQADYDLSNAQVTLANAGADDARYGYDGERINVGNSLKWELVANSTHASALQGGAAYGDYYFQFHGQNNKDGSGQPVLFYGVEVFNLKTRQKVQEILLGFDILKHNNAVTFSNVYYDENDPLPLIYASQENASARYCTVYRVTNTGDQDEPFALTMVQVIKLPPVSEANYYYPNCYVDGNKLIYGGFSNVDTTKYIYEVYPLPAISDGETLNIGTIQITDDGYGEPGTAQGYTLSDGSVVKANDNDSGNTIKAVYLDHTEVISTFTISKVNPYTGNNATTQGGVAKDGMLYVTFGSENNAVLKAVDVATGQVRSTINLVALGLNHEPETAFIYNYQLGVGFNSSGQIVVFNFN